MKKIQRALISVYDKSNILELVKLLEINKIEIISTGGTKKFLEKNNVQIQSVENITEYPSILGGRVKTLHPKIFGGILNRSNNEADNLEMEKFNIPSIDMVVVDLYPFEETVKTTNLQEDIIEKIDIGGVSLIRAAAKNFKDILVVSSKNDLKLAANLIVSQKAHTTLNDRLQFATNSFNVTASYEIAISKYFDYQLNKKSHFNKNFNINISNSSQLRYGENPHQKGVFYGKIDELFEQLNGKSLSYNNLLDIDAATHLMEEFSETSFAILKHNNACGVASDKDLTKAWKKALAGDPVSAFGGVLISNTNIDLDVAKEINNLFFEILIAPKFEKEAITLLKSKKNRIILKKKNAKLEEVSFRTVLNGVLCQQKDYITDQNNTKLVSDLKVSKAQMEDLIFASKICKHTKSNAIVLVKNKQLLGSGCGQTSRIDALKQAIVKANNFELQLKGAVMASDAFFPFPDCVEIAHSVGISAVIQPGGSKNDNLSIDYCNKHKMGMIFTETRHFKH